MTTINFDIRQGGGTEPLIGGVTFTPTRVRHDATSVTMPSPQTIGLHNGKGTMSGVTPTPDSPTPSWAYRAEIINGVTGERKSWLVSVPNQPTVDFDDLTKPTQITDPVVDLEKIVDSGIAATHVTEAGHLMITTMGGVTHDAGTVVGGQGLKGDDGGPIPPGGAAGQVPVRTASGGADWATPEDVISDYTDQHYVSRSVPQNLYQLAYRKSVHLHIPFKFPGWAAAMSTYGGAQGYVYPQAFNVDEQTNQLFISCPGDGYQVIVVRDWITGAFISYFAIQTTLTSEGLEIVYKGAQRLLYLRTYNNNMGQYDITTLPANGAVVTGSMVPLQSGMDFTRHNGVWTSNAITPPIGQYSPRGNMMRFTDDFTFLDGLNFGSIELGPWYGAPYDAYASELPKMQGICDAGGYYVVQMGAYASRGDRSRYGHIGLKVFDYQGNIAVTALMDQAKFLDILEQNGIGSSRSEGEGVQLVHGKLYSLTVTSTYNAANADTEGILFLREFSDEPNAIDFMPAALTFSTPNVESLASGLFPRTNGALRDPITGEAFSTLNQIITYMFATSQPRMAWYSSAVSVTDLAGASIPTGLLVEVYNRNNDSASMTWRGTRDYTWTIYKSGGTYMQQLASPVARGTDGNYELSVNSSGAVVAKKI